MRIAPKWSWFLAFTALFAVLAGYVFWGCWALNVTFVSPDDGVGFFTSYGDVLAQWWNGFVTSGRMQPTDLLWSGLLGSPLFCRELKYVVAIYCAALGMAYFLRGRGLPRVAAYGAGMLLAFCGYWFTLFSAGHGGWFIWMTYGVFAFGLIDRAIEVGRVRHWLLLGAVVAWGSFHQPDLWLLFSAFTGVYFVFRAIIARPAWKRLAKGVALSGVVFALVGAPSFHEALTSSLKGRKEQIEESKGTGLAGNSTDDAEAKWVFATNWSMPPNETAEFFCSRLNGDTSCPITLSVNHARGTRPYTGALGRPLNAKEGNYRQHSLYVGWVTCLLALVGVLGVVLRRRFAPQLSMVAFFAVSAVVFWLFSLGRYCEPAYRVVFALPFGDYLRAPVKWHHLTEFCICILAGCGIATLSGWIDAFAKGGSSIAKALRCALVAFVVIGAVDLASEARRFCAPVDYSRAISARCSSQLTVLARQQFYDPKIAEMVKRGVIVSVAKWLGSPDAYLVQLLEPIKPPKPEKPRPLPFALGIVSVLSAIGVAVACCAGTWKTFFWYNSDTNTHKENT